MPSWSRLARVGAMLSVPLLLGAAYADDPALTRILTRLQEYYAGENPEKVYLHFDKPYYATGETVWFRAYVVEAGQHRPDTLSRVLYADLLAPNGRVVTQRTLRLSQAGAAGELALADTLAAGVYTVRAYTSWMRNGNADYLFSRRVPVYRLAAGVARPAAAPAGKSRLSTAAPAAARPDVQFFPEGGNLVAGLDNTVAFKATDATGLGVAVKGMVLNAHNQEITAFDTRHRGMGTFPLRPEPGQSYRARVQLPTGGTAEYPLPAVQATGYTLAVRTIGETLLLVVQRRDAPGTPATVPVTVVAHVRGQVAYAGQAQLATGTAFSARIPRNRFPAGVAHFTLFDGASVPQAERLVFVPPAGLPRLTLTPDKPSYGPRERVTVTVDVRDAAGQPVAADLSLAATQAPELPGTATFGENIQTNLLLTSDLRGLVEDPAWYFREGNAAGPMALDNLLLTQGWRRFVWRELLSPEPAAARLYPLEQGLSIAGQVLRPPGRKPADQTDVTLFITKPRQEILQGRTSADGRFLFTGFQWNDTAQVLLQARQGKTGNLLIRLLPPWPAAARTPFVLPELSPDAPDWQAYAARSRRQQQAEQQFRLDTTKRILLGNVTVKGRKPREEPADGHFRLHSAAGADVVKAADVVGAASFSSPLQLLQGRVAGVQIFGSGLDMSAQIRGATSLQGSNAPLYLLDGVPVDAAAINSVPTSDVETIEVIKGAAAAIYGSMGGSNGAIAVYTRRGNPSYDYKKEPVPGSVTLRPPGFYRVREFYAPRYDAPQPPARPDPRRTTLYWTPRVRTDASGRAQLTFFTSEEAGTFQLTAEGLTANGQPGLGRAEVNVTGR